MDSRHVDRFFDVLSKPKILNDSLKNSWLAINLNTILFYFFNSNYSYINCSCCYLGTTRRSHNRADFAVCIDDHGRRHWRQRPLARLDKICRTRWQSVGACDFGGREIVHFVVQDDTLLFRCKSSTETGQYNSNGILYFVCCVYYIALKNISSGKAPFSSQYFLERACACILKINGRCNRDGPALLGQ